MIHLYCFRKELRTILRNDVDIEFLTKYISVFPLWLAYGGRIVNIRIKAEVVNPDDIFTIHETFKTLACKLDDSVVTHLQTRGGSCSIVDDTLIIRIKD